jgi:hypothetical protein
MTFPLVSIITPTFNGARFLEKCIKSVLAQDYPNVEHVIQDGGSKDGTIDILKSQDASVKWETAPDKNQADGLDKALKRSSGDVLLVLNADDMLLPGACQWGVEWLMKQPDLAVVYGDLILIDEDGIQTGEYIGPEYDFESVFSVERVIPAQAAFIRRTALEEVGLRADPSLGTCPDFEMFVRLGLRFPMRHELGFVAEYRYYPRWMDGATQRTVERFVEAKSTVINRVIDDDRTPVDLRRLRRRAMAGLHLWASEESRSVGKVGEAWQYYARAAELYGPAGFPLRLLALFGRGLYELSRRWKAVEPRPRTSPTYARALFVGAGLWQITMQALAESWVGKRGVAFLDGLRRLFGTTLKGLVNVIRALGGAIAIVWLLLLGASGVVFLLYLLGMINFR